VHEKEIVYVKLAFPFMAAYLVIAGEKVWIV
jgi:hypothetical protein